jgi:hypothetical protein
MPGIDTAKVAAGAVAPVVLGVALRLLNLHDQILVEDEVHAVRTALLYPLDQILFTYRTEDPSLPLAALYRLSVDAGLRLSEIGLRLPVLIASVAAVFVLPWLAASWVERRTALLWSWLLAMSPILVLYGRMVRPYGLIALLVPASALMFLGFCTTKRVSRAVAFSILASLSLYVHLGTAPMLIAIFAFAVGEKLVRSSKALGWRELVFAASCTAALSSLFLIPAWDSLGPLIEAKGMRRRFDLGSTPPLLSLQTGSRSLALAIFIGAVALLGLVVLLRRQRRLALFTLTLVLAQWFGLALLAPAGIRSPLILNRYLIPTLPFLLLWVAAGVASMARRLDSVGSIRLVPFGSVLVAVFLGALALAGPFAEPQFRGSSFMHSKDFLRFDTPRGQLAPDGIPVFYHRVPAPGALVEFPHSGSWNSTRAHYVYQSLHRRRVIVAERDPLFCDDRLRLRNHVCATVEAIAESPARYVVVHADPLAEELAIAGGDDSGTRVMADDWAAMARDARTLRRKLRRKLGGGVYLDRQVVVWDLRRGVTPATPAYDRAPSAARPRSQRTREAP